MNKKRIVFLIIISVLFIGLFITGLVIKNKKKQNTDYVFDQITEYTKYISETHPTKIIWLGRTIPSQYNLEIEYIRDFSADCLNVSDNYEHILFVINDIYDDLENLDEVWDIILPQYDTRMDFSIMYFGNSEFENLAERCYTDTSIYSYLSQEIEITSVYFGFDSGEKTIINQTATRTQPEKVEFFYEDAMITFITDELDCIYGDKPTWSIFTE